MRLRTAAFSNVGPRSSNDDRYFVTPSGVVDAALVAIADGMGGALGGGEAAEIAIETAKEFGPDPGRLETMFHDVVLRLRDAVKQSPEKSRMGTTLSVACINNKTVNVAHVGDTRIYHLRGGGLNSLTEDQTEIAELVRRGVFSPAQARRYPRKNVLLSALTTSGEYSIFRSVAKLEDGDRLLLISDGVHQKVNRGGVLNASTQNRDLGEFLNDLELRVGGAAPSDNFTAVGLELQPD